MATESKTDPESVIVSEGDVDKEKESSDIKSFITIYNDKIKDKKMKFKVLIKDILPTEEDIADKDHEDDEDDDSNYEIVEVSGKDIDFSVRQGEEVNTYKVEQLLNYFNVEEDEELFGDALNDDDIPKLEASAKNFKQFITHLQILQKYGPFTLEQPLKHVKMIDNGFPEELDSVFPRKEKDPAYYDDDNIFALMEMADNLGCEIMVDYYCAIIASMLKGKSPEELRELMEVEEEDDLTEEERKHMEEETKWVEEEAAAARADAERERAKIREEQKRLLEEDSDDDDSDDDDDMKDDKKELVKEEEDD